MSTDNLVCGHLKRIFMKLLVLLLLITPLHSFGFNLKKLHQVLDDEKVSLEQLMDKSSMVLLGELTGNGITIDSNQIKMIITDQGIIQPKDIEKIEFKRDKKGRVISKSISQIKHFKTDQFIIRPINNAIVTPGPAPLDNIPVYLLAHRNDLCKCSSRYS